MNRTLSAAVAAWAILASQGVAQESKDKPTPSPEPIRSTILVTTNVMTQPNSPSIKAHVYSIRYAKASYIKDILAEIASAADGDDLVRGKVKIVADDRTNKLIILTDPNNMRFIEKMVCELDVRVEETTGVQQTTGGDSSTPAARASRPPQK